MSARFSKAVICRRNGFHRDTFFKIHTEHVTAGITKIFPGAISIKYATYTGYKIGGFSGMLWANLGNLLAPILFVFFASIFYVKFKDLAGVKGAFQMIQLVMFSMLIAVSFQLINFNQLIIPRNFAIILISFLLFSCTKIHPAIIIITAGIIGIFLK